MKTLSTLVFVIVGAAASACGSDANPADEPDAQAAAVSSVACAGATIAATVTTSGLAYSPVDTNISVGQIVEFTPAGTHDVNGEAPGFDVPLGGTGCFRFDAAGTYPFRCTPHNFTGSIVVQ